MKRKAGSFLIAVAVCLSLCFLANEEMYFVDAVIVASIGFLVYFGLDMITNED